MCQGGDVSHGHRVAQTAAFAVCGLSFPMVEQAADTKAEVRATPLGTLDSFHSNRLRRAPTRLLIARENIIY
jgi:hypothetical protein